MSKLQALADTVRRRVHLVDVDHLIARLTGLARQHEERSRISHALGVRSAIALIQRDMATQAKVDKNKFPVSSARHDQEADTQF